MATTNADLKSFYAHSDRVQLLVLISLFLFSFALANWYDTWSIAFLIGIPTLAIPVGLIFALPGALLTRLAVAVAYMVFAGLHIHQGHGMTELHFGIFGLLAFLLYYRDWLVIVTAAAVIAVHHLWFNFLQGNGYPIYVFEHGTSFTMVLTHAAYVVFESAFLVYMALESAKEARRNIELQEISQDFMLDHGTIDLTHRHENLGSAFAKDFNNFMGAVNKAIGSSQHVAARLTNAIKELQNLSTSTKQGTEIQRANSTNMLSSINEMASSLQNVVQHSKNAAQAARQADQLVNNGSLVITETIKSLTDLAKSVEEASGVIQLLENRTTQIGSVLEVIKGIADQTNLLALNAAIEAARAGEQGRGFAVVADEVRTLASRTQKSTEDIQTMIEQLQNQAKNAVVVMKNGSERAQQGMQQAAGTNDAFNSIAKSVAVISEMNNQIAHAGEQQSFMVNNIQNNIQSISTTANDNMEHAGSLDTLAHELVKLSDELKVLVGKFTV